MSEGIRRVGAHLVFGLAAGALVFLLEAIDRTRALRHNLYGADEALRLVALTAAIVLLVGLLSVPAGALWTLADVLRARVTARLRRVPERWRALAGLLVAAAVVAVALRTVSWFFPTVIEGSVLRLIRRVDTRLTSLGPVGEHPKVVYTLLVAAASLALMAVHAWLFSPRGPRARIGSAVAAAACFAFTFVAYLADSRVEFTRYEGMFHIPLEVIYCGVALVGVTAAARSLGDPVRVALSRPMLAVAAAAGHLGAGSLF
jgi:hypothetical protein